MQQPKNTKILVVGESEQTFSVAVCLLAAGHPVTLYTKEKNNAAKAIMLHFEDLLKLEKKEYAYHVNITDNLKATEDHKLAIVVNNELLEEKRALIKEIEACCTNDIGIAINTESIALSKLQEEAKKPENIFGANWTLPAHTTYFLELISNDQVKSGLTSKIDNYASGYWAKNPYIITGDYGIRSQMMTAMIREAFFLVENGYASIADIDRACRNDAGYYLPFSGNFRYMDLMGTAAYGMVMKDLNPELANETVLPQFFKTILSNKQADGAGMYPSTEEELALEKERSRKFSYEIKSIIEKYPSL